MMMHPKYFSILILLVLTTFTSTFCQTTTTAVKVETKSEEHRKSRKVFWDNPPDSAGLVNDYENLYTDIEEAILDSLITNFEKTTTVQIVVITFDTTLISSDSLDALTLRLGNHWGVGQKNKNNGVVIGISRGYRKMRIQNGYGIEKILSDAETKIIIETVFIPHFRNGEYYEGTSNGLKILMATLIEKLN